MVSTEPGAAAPAEPLGEHATPQHDDDLTASAGEKAPLNDLDAAGPDAPEGAAEESEEYLEEEHVVVMRRPAFIAMIAIPLLLVVGLAALNLFQWRRSSPAVATVDGSAITRSDYDRAVARGDGGQILDGLISRRLVERDAAHHHVAVTPDEIDAKLKETKAQFGSDAEYRQALDGQHLTEVQLRDSIRLNLMVQKLVFDKVQVSDTDMQAYYDKNKDTQFSGKSLDQVKDEVKKGASEEKQQAAVSTYLDTLHSGAKITKKLPGSV